MSSSKRKGDAYERELAAYLSEALGLTVERTPLSGGGRYDAQLPDVTGTPDIWVEAKRTERFEPRKAMAQAEKGLANRKSSDVPVIINRKNRDKTGDSLVVLKLDDFLRFYRSYLLQEGVLRDER